MSRKTILSLTALTVALGAAATARADVFDQQNTAATSVYSEFLTQSFTPDFEALAAIDLSCRVLNGNVDLKVTLKRGSTVVQTGGIKGAAATPTETWFRVPMVASLERGVSYSIVLEPQQRPGFNCAFASNNPYPRGELLTDPGADLRFRTVVDEMADPDLDRQSNAGGDPMFVDNCPSVANTAQTDVDGDGAGDACDGCPSDPLQTGAGGRDGDGDGLVDACDNCPGAWNRDQSDIDQDEVGDACDPAVSLPPGIDPDDVDGDGVVNELDNCAAVANATQEDEDRDGLGDACDLQDGRDLDGDTLLNADDPCPFDPDNACAATGGGCAAGGDAGAALGPALLAAAAVMTRRRKRA